MSEPIRSFTTAVPSWRSRVTPLNIEEASGAQLEAMGVTTSSTNIGEFILVLALDPETLLHLTPSSTELCLVRVDYPDQRPS